MLKDVKNEIRTYESYRVVPVQAAAASQTLTIQAGIHNLTGIALLSRLSSNENKVGDITTPAGIRYLIACPNSAITSLQFIIGDVQFPKQPIKNQAELFNFNKDFFKVNQDTDNGSLINAQNWANANKDTADVSLEDCDMRYMYFYLSRNGLASGIDMNVREMKIPIEQDDKVGIVYDCVDFYSRVLQIQGGKFRIMV